MRRLAFAAVVVAAAAASSACACGKDLGGATRSIESAQWRLVYRTLPEPIPVARHFTIEFALCPLGSAALPAQVRVDARMPEHQHGMNYQPSVTALGNGRYRAEGLMFHMPGRWELTFELRDDQSTPVRLTQSRQIG